MKTEKDVKLKITHTLTGVEINAKELLTWIEALKSGKYPQGRNALQSAEGFCCLGVACEVLISETHLSKYANKLSGCDPWNQPHAPYWLKVMNSDVNNRTGLGLMRANDENRYDFETIAQVLEDVYVYDYNNLQ